MKARATIVAAFIVAGCAACAARAPSAREPAAAADAEDAFAWREAESAGGTWRVRWRSEPETLAFGELARLVVEAADASGAAPDELRADAGMPEHGHGLLRRAQVVRLGTGRFAVEDLYLQMPGAWRLYLDLGRAGVFERVEIALEVD